MAELASTLEKIHLNSPDAEDNWIDQILEEQQQPRKRIKQDPEELKRELEQKYLTPSTSFSTEWLNKLQQYGLKPNRV
jgi:antiviral helicase SKI2